MKAKLIFLIFSLIKISFKIAPSSIVFSNSVLIKSSQAGGSSVFKNSKKVKYCKISNMEIKAPVKELVGPEAKERTKFPRTPTTAEVANKPETKYKF